MFEIKLPTEVQKILDILETNGYEAFIVGGCVRDSIIGRFASDWDVTTNALPEQVKALFTKTIDTGIKHGTVTILFGKMSVEVTTYRIDGTYKDNRHPSSVVFTRSIERDISRRDFTVNSIAYSPDRGYVDPFNGISDIGNKLIRAVGIAGDRFSEDALRMLRAIRFSAQLGYNVHSDTMKSIKEKCSMISKVSSERVRDELCKIILSDDPYKFMLLYDTGLLEYLMPELTDVIFKYSLISEQFVYLKYLFKEIEGSEKDICIRFSVLFAFFIKLTASLKQDVPEDSKFTGNMLDEDVVGGILYRFRFDNRSIKRVTEIIKNTGIVIEADMKSVMKAVSLLGKDIFSEVLKVKEALLKFDNSQSNNNSLDGLLAIKELYKEIITNGYCTDLKALAVNGNDLIELGYERGREIGIILKRLLDAVIEKPELNEKCRLLEIVSKMSDSA